MGLDGYTWTDGPLGTEGYTWTDSNVLMDGYIWTDALTEMATMSSWVDPE